MSLSSLITPSRLESLADYGYARGLKYWQEGRVLWCSQAGEMIEGEVAGKETYQVRVREYAKKLHWQCSCPIEGPMCKHVVALCLQFSSGASTLPPAPPPTPTPKTATVEGFATQAEAIAWVKAHDVEHELATSALVLMTSLYENYRNETGLHYMLARLTLRDVASMETASRFLGVRQLHRPAIEAARAHFVRMASDVVVGIAEEAQRSERAPSTTPTIAALWSKLLAVRASIRQTAVPRSRATRATGKLDFDPRAIRLVWEERAIARASLPGVGMVQATLAFSPAVAAVCACKQACTHILALIDATLDLLADPAQVGEATRIADELTRPAWQRALAAFALVPDEAPSAAPAVEVWWEIDEIYGTPTLAPVVRKPLKRGGWSAGTRITAQKLLGDHAASLDERDAKIAEHIASWVPVHRASTYPARAFAALVGHPRVRLADGEQPVSARRFPLGFTAMPVGDEIRLEPSVDGARFSPRLLVPLLQTFAAGEPLLVVEPEHERILLIDVSDEARTLWNALDKHGDAFPPEAHDQLLEQLSRLERRLPVSVPHQLKGALRAEQMTVVVRVRMTQETALELQPWIRPAPGAMLFPVAAGPRDVLVVQDGQRGYVRRDLSTELARVMAALARLPLETAEEGPPLNFSISDPDAALSLVAVLQAPPPGIEAEWIDRQTRVVARAATAQELKLKIERRRDWFGIEGQLVIEAGRLELAKLLDAARHQRKFVRLDDDRWLELTEQLRKRLLAIADQTYTTRNDLELSPGAVPAIRDAIAEGVTVEQPPSWEELTTRLAGSLKLRPRPPASLAEVLRPYQVEGHAWLSRVAAWGAGACLADDMGLGKTIQAIAVLIDRAKVGPTLVLAPTSVTLNWVDELKKFAPKLVPVIYADAVDRAQCLAKLKKGDVLIASYGLLARDIGLLSSIVFGTLVIDEAQAIKNPATQRTKAARKLRADFRIALSGTPVENNLGELWSLFSVVFPGLLGSWEQFRDRYAFPIERQDSAEARQGLSRVIRPFLLRRTKGEVARDLPSRTEIQVPIALSSEELAIYEDARLIAVSHLAKEVKTTREERQRFQVLAALTKLRLIASHPRLHDPQSPVASSKMQRLLELLDELRAAGHRALVFSQFTSHLALVQPELTQAGISWLYLDGSTPTKQRKALIERFQAGEGDVFLLSLKAGGTGVNLTAADYVIHLDPWWNPAVEDQATDRAHRIGQTKPVTVYRLISRGTVEERIQQMHHGKRALIAGVLDGSDAAAKLTTKDLMSLLAEVG